MVMVAEGIEDALTAAQARLNFRAIAEVSVPTMANITLPASGGTVMVIADNDAESSAADGSLDRASSTLRNRVSRCSRPARRMGMAKDLNEIAQKSDVSTQMAGEVA